MKTLSDTLNLLFRKDVGPTFNDIMEIVNTDMRMIVQYYINMDKQSPLAVNIYLYFFFLSKTCSENKLHCRVVLSQ